MWPRRLLWPSLGAQSRPGCTHGIFAGWLWPGCVFFLLSRELLECDWLRKHRPHSMLTCLEESRRPRGTGQAG